MNSTRELSTLIGRVGVMRTPQPIRFGVRIIDARISWGKIQVEIEPLAGTGRVWVDQTSVTLDGSTH